MRSSDAPTARARAMAHAASSVSVLTIRLRASGTLNALSRSGSACASSASAAAANAASVAGPPRRAASASVGAPRDVGDAAERDPARRAIVPSRELERRRDRDDRERVGRAVADLAVARVAARAGSGGQLDGGDQVAGLEHRVALGLVAGQAVQARHRDRLPPAVDVHRARRGRRARPPCRTGASRRSSRVAEDRQVAVIALARGTARARLALVAGLRRRPGSTKQRVRWSRLPPTVARLRSWPDAPASSACDEHRVALAHERVRGEVGCCARPRRSAARRPRSPRSGRGRGGSRRRARPASRPRAASGRRGSSRRRGSGAPCAASSSTAAADVRGALVRERPSSPDRRAIAATMFVYAPQRQRLPLMRSRISASSDVRQSPTTLGQPSRASPSMPDGRAELSRRAVAALERVVVDERLLQRVQLVAARQPFDRRDLRAVVRDRQREAGVHPPAVEQHRARAALAVVAALLGARSGRGARAAGRAGGPRVDDDAARLAVDPHLEARLHAEALPTLAAGGVSPRRRTSARAARRGAGRRTPRRR